MTTFANSEVKEEYYEDVYETNAQDDEGGYEIGVQASEPLPAPVPSSVVESRINQERIIEATINEKVLETYTEEFRKGARILQYRFPQERFVCYHLGIDDPHKTIQESFSAHYGLISELHDELLEEFMKTEGYTLVGTNSFCQDGSVTTPIYYCKKIDGEMKQWVSSGFLYFEKINDRKKETNIICQVKHNPEMTLFRVDFMSSKKDNIENVVTRFEVYTKKHNMLRNKHIQDVYPLHGEFNFIEQFSQSEWDKYYYDKSTQDIVQKEIVDFVIRPEKYNKRGIFKRGFLFYGPPGTGKTTLLKIICNTVYNKCGVVWLTPDNLTNENTRSIITSIFHLVEYMSPAIVIIEDIDLFAEDREKASHNVKLGTLMNVLDGVHNLHNVVTIATTNRMDTIEKALRSRPGRIDRHIKIDSMDQKLREKMIIDRMKDFTIGTDSIKYITQETDGWNGSEIQELINTIKLSNIDSKDDNVIISKENVDDAIKRMRDFGTIDVNNSKIGF